MRPEQLGTPSEKNEVAEEPEAKEEDDDSDEFENIKTTQIDENETQLLRQSFLLNPTMTTHEYLESHSAKLVWFMRAELGAESA